MSDVIDFLERMGRDAALRYASRAQLAAALDSAGFSPELQATLLGADRRAFERTVGAETNICNMINVPLQEEEEQVPVRRDPCTPVLRLGSDNVCCMVFAPIEGQEQPQEPQETRVAA